MSMIHRVVIREKPPSKRPRKQSSSQKIARTINQNTVTTSSQKIARTINQNTVITSRQKIA